MKSLRDSLDDELLDNDIELKNCTLPTQIKGMSVYIPNLLKTIVIDEEQANEPFEYNVVLAHELEHFEHPSSFYTLDFSSYDKKRKERKIEILTFKKLIPMEKLAKAIYCTKMSFDEIAEYFEVPPKTLLGAISYYLNLESWKELVDQYADISILN